MNFGSGANRLHEHSTIPTTEPPRDSLRLWPKSAGGWTRSRAHRAASDLDDLAGRDPPERIDLVGR